MEEFALIKSRVNLSRVNYALEGPKLRYYTPSPKFNEGLDSHNIE